MARRTRSVGGSGSAEKALPKRTKNTAASAGELAETIAHANKRYGQGTATYAKHIKQPDRLSTGSFIFDLATLGGIPHNRCSMIVGERHAGKTMMASLCMRSAQMMFPKMTPVFIDVEGTFDSTWAGKLGVDLDSLPIIRPETGEMAVDMADALTGSAETSLVVVDSLAALVPMREIDTSAEDAHVGLQARLIGGMVRKITAGLIKERKRGHFVTVLFLNQFRSKIGGFSRDPRTIPGGKALEFCTSLQAIIKNKENKGKDALGIDTVVENEHPFTITKNKLCNGPRTGEFRMVREFEESTGLQAGAIDNAPTILAYAKKFGLYSGGGSSWKLEFLDHKYKFGKAAQAVKMLNEDERLQWRLRTFLIQLQAAEQAMPADFIKRLELQRPGWM